MGGYEWTNDEIAVAIYFASRGINHSVIAEFLTKHGFQRSKGSVDSKLSELRKKNPYLGIARSWDSTAVNIWVTQHLVDHSLLQLDEEDRNIISMLQPEFDWAVLS